MNYELRKKTKGFTLVEVMIAVGLFVVVMVAGIGAVLSANNSHKKTQAQRAILDNLSFIMEDVARNIRLGSNYICPSDWSGPYPSDPSDPNYDEPFSANPLTTTSSIPDDCGLNDEANSIVFEGQNGDSENETDQIGYAFVENGVNGSYRLYKTSDNGDLFYPISPGEVEMDSQSGFTVIGSALGPGDVIQPRVIIRMSGNIRFKDVVSPFELQTTVSQRLIDS